MSCFQAGKGGRVSLLNQALLARQPFILNDAQTFAAPALRGRGDEVLWGVRREAYSPMACVISRSLTASGVTTASFNINLPRSRRSK